MNQPATLSRRELLSHSARVSALLAATGLVPQPAHASYRADAFAAKGMAELMTALGGSAPVESGEVSITAPDIAENGAVVPVVVATTLTGVNRLLLLVEKNPNLMAAMFEVNDAVDASFATRVKMGETSTVYGVAMLAGGQVRFARKDVAVTLGGCGD